MSYSLITRLTGLPRLRWWWATAAGVLVGAAYSLSPTTVVFLSAVPLLFWWAQRDVGPRERRWTLGVLGVALIARLAALAVFFVLADHVNDPFAVLVGDERRIKTQSVWILNLALGHTLAPFDYAVVFDNYGRSSFMTLLAYWQLWFGPAPYGAHLINVALWFAGAIALYRTARRAFGPLPALGGFVIVLFMPTLFVWSMSALKEPAYFFLTAVIIAGATAVVRETGLSGRVTALMLVAVAVAAMGTLRSIGLFVAAGGLVTGIAAWVLTRRAWLCGVAIVFAAAGVNWALHQPATEERLMQEFRLAATLHLGNVNTTGYSYKLLDERFYQGHQHSDFRDMLPAEAARFAARAAASFFLVPLPWRSTSMTALALVPQQIAWYVLAAFAFVGVWAGWRRDAVFTWLLLGNAVVGAAAVSLFNGNVGTFVRMRDTVVPVIVWLSALGGCVAFEWIGCRFIRGAQHGHS